MRNIALASLAPACATLACLTLALGAFSTPAFAQLSPGAAVQGMVAAQSPAPRNDGGRRANAQPQKQNEQRHADTGRKKRQQ